MGPGVAPARFNTTLVLLRVIKKRLLAAREFVFQHHSGAIEGGEHAGHIWVVTQFQHHSGAIEGNLQLQTAATSAFVSTPLWCY